MRVPSLMIGLLLAVGLAGGCATHAEPLTIPGAPALNAPEPPGRYVLPTTEPQTLPPAIEDPAPSSTAPVTAKPPGRTQGPRPAAPPPVVEPPAPTPTPTPTPAILSTPASADFQQRIERQLSRATADLASVNRSALGTDAQAQWDAAQGFIRQAQEALKVKNLMYAGQLADKAATMAALLKK